MPNNYVLFSEAIGPLTAEEEQWWVSTIEAIENSTDEEKVYDAVDFQWQIQNHEVWFYSEEGGDYGQVCELVRQFFQAHRPDDRFTMRWAETCSKPAIGQFMGGMAAVTKWGVTYLDTEAWEDAEFKHHDMLKGEING